MRTPPLAALALALPLLAAPPRAAAFEPTGEISMSAGGLTGGGASWDQDRVVGPLVNVSRQESGGWAGDLRGQNMALEVTPTRLSGAGVSITVERSGGTTSVEGIFFGQRVRITVEPKKLTGRYGTCSLDLKRRTEGSYRGDVGCMRENAFPTAGRVQLRLMGDATGEAPPLPQFVIALLAVLPS